MAITVDTAATATDLTIVATVKTELGISNNDDDTFLGTLIKQASAFIRKYTGRVFERQTLTETLPGTGFVDLYTTRTPIISITSITLNGTELSSDEYTLNDADIGQIIRHDDADVPSGVVWPLSNRPRSGLSLHIQWGAFANNISITYVAGYLLPAEDARTLPRDLERACIELVKMFFEKRTSDPSVRFEKIGDAAQAFEVNKQLPLTITMVLDRWVRIPV